MRRALHLIVLSVLASLVLTLVAHRVAPSLVPQPETQHAEKSAEPTSTIGWEGSHGKRVLVLGHGFARDWFVHWGGSGLEPAGRGGLTLGFGDLEAAPRGTAAIRKHVGEAPEGCVVVYAPGPDELRGGSAKAATDSAGRLLAEVDVVVKAAGQRGLKVVAGGPLPSLPGDTDRHLLDAHDAYADGLRARESDGLLTVFDAYEHVTTPGQVTLTRGYALTQADSRMGGAGLAALDELFFPFMLEQF